MDDIEQLDVAISALMRVLVIDERRSLSTNAGVPFNPIDLEALSFVNRHPESSAKDVSNYLGVRSTTMQSVVDRLVKRSLLKRDKIALKGRAVALSLTETGLQVQDELRAHNLKNCKQILASLDEDERQGFVKNMTLIAAALF